MELLVALDVLRPSSCGRIVGMLHKWILTLLRRQSLLASRNPAAKPLRLKLCLNVTSTYSYMYLRQYLLSFSFADATKEGA
jgi:hypothetical protein